MLQEKILTGKRLFTGEMLDHLIADVSEKSKMKFDVKIETDKLVYSVSPGRVAIAAAPVKSEKKNLQGWRDSAVVFFEAVTQNSKMEIPFGMYILQHNEKSSRFVDENGNSYLEDKPSVIARTTEVTVGWVTITIGPIDSCVGYTDKNVTKYKCVKTK